MLVSTTLYSSSAPGTRYTGISGEQNSRMTCRQSPQGVIVPLTLLTIAMALKDRIPSLCESQSQMLCVVSKLPYYCFDYCGAFCTYSFR